MTDLKRYRNLFKYVKSLQPNTPAEFDAEDIAALQIAVSRLLAEELVHRFPICPHCGGQVIVTDDHAECSVCGKKYV